MVKIIYPQSRVLFREILAERRVQRYLRELRRHHRESYEHCLRVGLLSIDLGYENSFGKTNTRYLGYAGLLHDIGKLRVPIGVLTKPTGLDDAELKIMKEHPRLGFLELHDFGYEEVRQIIVAHHECKQDPYPRKGSDRRKSERKQNGRRKFKRNIVKLAQIVAISDIYDALAMRRAYKPALEPKEIERILRAQFVGDPRHIDKVLARQ